MTTAGPAPDETLRIVGIADTDSYLKWGAALLGAQIPGARVTFLILQTPLVVSPRQEAAALADSGIDDVRRIRPADLAATLQALRPDAVLLSARGPLVRVLARVVARLDPRPVIVTGLPGISIPATRKALLFRRQCDLFVLHSRREIKDFRALANAMTLTPRFALARLPFASETKRRGRGGTDLVFAAQALVPRELPERVRVAEILRDAALADPSRRVVVKVRGSAGEKQTHEEQHALPDLIERLGPVPPNLVVDDGPMARALDRAQGLVTVSSTAAIEAVARGIPVIALDDFGVSDELINIVFIGSGLFGDRDAVVARDFRGPDPAWVRDNYLHDRSEDDWFERTRALVLLRRSGRLPARPAPVGRGGALREAWDRRIVLGRDDPARTGVLALAIGVPLRAAVRLVRRVAPVRGGGRRTHRRDWAEAQRRRTA